ncbi:uncharacterized protein LOC131079051 isoform X2 [Cryptomeria japonica]|uniref:uncharacterized protein LOC131079051 isoform X2 n=1 Tax=Cryptomeria japonica TaxID=3369 RepID=UPI0025AC3453|nr:uncharacterized protein LOC131079051 isoform X2 [Cryptomeria japonica]
MNFCIKLISMDNCLHFIQKVCKERTKEEIDAPHWTDLALEGNLNAHDRDDTWFHTEHLFHQHSFQDLVSSSSLGFKVKGKVSNSVYLSPTDVHSVTKSRVRTHENPAQPMKKGRSVPFKLPDSKSPFNCKLRHLGENTSCMSKDEGNLHPNPRLSKPNSDSSTNFSSSGSTSSKNELNDCAHVLNNIHKQTEPSIIAELKATMPRTTGLLAALKSRNLKRSHGALPAVRVEFKDEQKSTDAGASTIQCGTESLPDNNRKTSCNRKLQKANNEMKTIRVRKQTGYCIVSPTGNGKTKLNVGSFGTFEASNTMNKKERTSAKLEVMTLTAKIQHGQSIKGSRRPLQEITNVGMPQFQCQGSAAFEKENTNLATAPHHKVSMEGEKKTTRGYLVQAKVRDTSQPRVKANQTRLVRKVRKGP